MPKKPRTATVVLSVLLALSLLGNGALFAWGLADKWQEIDQNGANSHENYFTLHRVREAQG